MEELIVAVEATEAEVIVSTLNQVQEVAQMNAIVNNNPVAAVQTALTPAANTTLNSAPTSTTYPILKIVFVLSLSHMLKRLSMPMLLKMQNVAFHLYSLPKLPSTLK